MPYNNSIQCPPSEDYDRHHSMIIALSSLECLLVSFDAIMDSLDSSTEKLSKRVDKLYDRCDRIRNHISKNKSHVTLTFSPESVPNKSDEIGRKSSNSFLREACDQSNAAIQECIIRDRDKVDYSSKASISDAWLDRGDAFEEEVLCRNSLSNYTIPDVMRNQGDLSKGTDEKISPPSCKSIQEEVQCEPSHILRTQQGSSGSVPFLCELLHDTYGCGASTFGELEPCQILPSAKTIVELKNTMRLTEQSD